jgi:UDP-N-acetylmuramoylalanine--D-glutamate ligase
MKIAILGFDVEGRASFDYFRSLGNELTIRDQNPDTEIPPDVPTVLGDGYLDDLEQFDLLVRTAGLPPSKILDKNPSVEGKITTLINEFFKACPTKNVIGVTGTKGKGTTSTLIAKMLEANNKQVFVGGNIGIAPLTFLNELTPDSWVVLELSSYQLTDIKYSPHIAVSLMVVPEHLNWHKTMEDYIQAKSNLFSYQTEEDKAIYFADNELSKSIASSGKGQKIAFFEKPGALVENDNIVIDDQIVCSTKDLKLIGKHNWQNVCAAVTAVWQVSKNIEAMRSIVTSFKGLEHRLEFVRQLNEVEYYNDSFASTPDAAMAALDALPKKKVIIVGGFDRNLPLDNLAKSIAKHDGDITKVIIIGASAKRLAHELETLNFTNWTILETSDMKKIVATAAQLAQPNDCVVLSPGFASFDMFKNFEERGQLYKDSVNNL